jgi:hypothetical protein
MDISGLFLGFWAWIGIRSKSEQRLREKSPISHGDSTASVTGPGPGARIRGPYGHRFASRIPVPKGRDDTKPTKTRVDLADQAALSYLSGPVPSFGSTQRNMLKNPTQVNPFGHLQTPLRENPFGHLQKPVGTGTISLTEVFLSRKSHQIVALK